MTRTDRYRPRFCSPDFYQRHQRTFANWVRRFDGLTPNEKIQAWVLGLTILRRPTDWFGGIRRTPILCANETSVAHALSLNDLLTEDSLIKVPQRLDPTINLFAIANTVHVKPLPASCMRSLVHFYSGRYPLTVVNHVPTPTELLGFQVQGRRIISFNEDFESWPRIDYHGRDFLSFMIHDLIHADHFFADLKNRAGQLGFYRCVANVLRDQNLQLLLEKDTFKNSFEYVISDMNAHPVHLFKTLKAHVDHAFVDRTQGANVWQRWTEVWSSEDLTLISALQKINTQLFSDRDAHEITSMCIAMGQNKALAESL